MLVFGGFGDGDGGGGSGGVVGEGVGVGVLSSGGDVSSSQVVEMGTRNDLHQRRKPTSGEEGESEGRRGMGRRREGKRVAEARRGKVRQVW